MTAPIDSKLLFQTLFAEAAKKRSTSAKKVIAPALQPPIIVPQPPPSPTGTVSASTLNLQRDETPSDEDGGEERFDDVEIAMPAAPAPSIIPRATKASRRQSIRAQQPPPVSRPTTPRTPKRQVAAPVAYDDEEIALTEEAQIVDNGTIEISTEIQSELENLNTKNLVRRALSKSIRCIEFILAPVISLFVVYRVVMSQL